MRMTISEAQARQLVGRVIAAAQDPAASAALVAAAPGPPRVLDALASLAGAVDPAVAWVGVNGGRVDAVVSAGDGAEWRIVLVAGDGRDIEQLDIIERPPPLAPIPGGRLVVVNGPSGAGKSELLSQLTRRSRTPWVVFDEPTYGAVDDAFLVWRDAAEPLHRGFLAGMAALAAEGNQVATSAAGHPQDWFRRAVADVPTLYVGLHCPRAVLLEREQGRTGRWGGLAEASLGDHDGWDYDLELDSEHTPPADLADAVLAALG